MEWAGDAAEEQTKRCRGSGSAGADPLEQQDPQLMMLELADLLKRTIRQSEQREEKREARLKVLEKTLMER